jgi:hypothetical protein
MLFLQESLDVVRRKCHGNRWIPAESQFFKVLVFSVFPCSSVLGPDQVVPQGKIDGQISRALIKTSGGHNNMLLGFLIVKSPPATRRGQQNKFRLKSIPEKAGSRDWETAVRFQPKKMRPSLHFDQDRFGRLSFIHYPPSLHRLWR